MVHEKQGMPSDKPPEPWALSELPWAKMSPTYYAFFIPGEEYVSFPSTRRENEEA